VSFSQYPTELHNTEHVNYYPGAIESRLQVDRWSSEQPIRDQHKPEHVYLLVHRMNVLSEFACVGFCGIDVAVKAAAAAAIEIHREVCRCQNLVARDRARRHFTRVDR
jgi:hypothetical protein